jgi:hypothetical protein
MSGVTIGEVTMGEISFFVFMCVIVAGLIGLGFAWGAERVIRRMGRIHLTVNVNSDRG